MFGLVSFKYAIPDTTTVCIHRRFATNRDVECARMIRASCRDNFNPLEDPQLVSCVLMKRDAIKHEWQLPISARHIDCDLVLIDPPTGTKDSWLLEKNEKPNWDSWGAKDLHEAIDIALASGAIQGMFRVAILCKAATLGIALQGLSNAGLQFPKVSVMLF